MAVELDPLALARRRSVPTRTIRRKPRPCVRMRELLSEIRALGVIVSGGECFVLPGPSFDEAWEVAWTVMRREKAWPHATVERHQWQRVLNETRYEFERCWNGEPSPFARISTMILALVEDVDVKGEDGVVIALALA